jgi:hypothetical protein
MKRTSKKHFEIFKNECQKWVDKFELNNWDIKYHWKKLEKFDGGENIGVATYSAEVYLDKEIEDEHADTDLTKFVKKTAKHEILHILLKRLAINASARYINECELTEAEEELVRKLEKII